MHLYGIDLRIQDAFLFAQWASDEFTVRIHNHTVAEVDSLIDIRVCGLGPGLGDGALRDQGHTAGSGLDFAFDDPALHRLWI
jgi:hypothetical protein